MFGASEWCTALQQAMMTWGMQPGLALTQRQDGGQLNHLSGPPASSPVRTRRVKRSDPSDSRGPAAAVMACVTSEDGLPSFACITHDARQIRISQLHRC